MDEPFLPYIEDTTTTPRARTRTRRQLPSSYLDGRSGLDSGSPRASIPFIPGYIDRGTPRSQSPLGRVTLNNYNNPFLRLNSIEGRKLLHKQSALSLLNDSISDNSKTLNQTPILATTPLDKDLIINFDRSSSAPPLFTEEKGPVNFDDLDHKHHHSKITPKILHLALFGLFLYIIVGVTVFTVTHDTFKGERTVKIVDALYFTVVTLSTIGYGDIIPASNFTKLFTCIFILVGFGFIGILLNELVTYVLDLQEEVLLDEAKLNRLIRNYLINKEKGRMRIRTKVCLALGVVIVFLAIGTFTVHSFEELSWVDSFYLSVTSVTTVGYGDHAFKTVGGRCFAVVWLLASTLAVAKAFLYLTEYRLDKRNRRMAKEVLKKKMTVGELVAADMDHDGSISKSEYVIFKLKEMGMITESDVEEICKQFDALAHSYCRKIPITGFIEDDTETDTDSEAVNHEANREQT